MMTMVASNPFPALFDDEPKGGYPKSEMGYIRAYFRDGRWYNSCFPVGEFKKSLASEFDHIYTQFTKLCPTLNNMRKMCRENAKCTGTWCGYDQFEGYLETPIALYRFVMRFTPGDYNLYLHCYDRYQIPWSHAESVFDRAYENYECGYEIFNATSYLDFNVSMEKSKLLKIYADLQREFNGDIVTYPDVGGEKYVGNFAEFILSCNGKEGFSRTNEDVDHLDFAI